MSDKNLERMKNYVETVTPKLMRRGKVPGFSIAIVKDGVILYAEGFGVRNLEDSLPATPHTLYCIGSCTKSFVALSVLKLVEKGKIGLDDPVSKYIPLKIGVQDKPITIHHLLTHSSGIPSLGTSTIALQRGMGRYVGIPFGSVNDFYRHINGAQEEIADEPGKRFFYFNAGYRMLGHIVQKVSKRSLDAYIREEILKPLKMNRTTLLKEEFEKDPDRMTPYRKDREGKLIPARFPYPNVRDNLEFSFIAAAGGMLSSVTELTNYLTATINKGRFGDVEILSPELMEEMQRIYMERSQTHFGTYGYGYGWGVVENFLGTKYVSHGGSIGVSTAHLAFMPEKKIGVAMASKTSGFTYGTVAQEIFATLMGKDPEKVLPILEIQRKMNMLTGTYEIYRGLSRVEVAIRRGLLYLGQTPLIPEDEKMRTYRFYTLSDGIKSPIEFVVDSPEKIDLYQERNRYHKIKT